MKLKKRIEKIEQKFVYKRNDYALFVLPQDVSYDECSKLQEMGLIDDLIPDAETVCFISELYAPKPNDFDFLEPWRKTFERVRELKKRFLDKRNSIL